ncbi:hypothetical protein HK413_01225 [Mucilaginibacter sp. S1162]|uniref:Uncharacterized protein n=1 Tax=Mucilaginibacter humi TaxID=2732510 RepID=A0ABX1W501_9SPHI|nr:hypothetical protein [Mucilaginibacter humi]NNU33142.1 hypothetical protein [Mucilaginibacter humi]
MTEGGALLTGYCTVSGTELSSSDPKKKNVWQHNCANARGKLAISHRTAFI